ncbi:heparan-alpha-glucosaminide N-acetyltransferase domain-containing protein [Microbacterium sp. NPDC057407]|uniref:heparan-alpha-glucosaminide N-acetyltransferase domain-containing protein n=1 Tax=Microbacterium sp. NPDC057407 TaxID=3346120 RepID=UPI003671D6E0
MADAQGRTWLATRWLRLNGPDRVAGVDLARGLAVLGMFAAHLLWIRDPFRWGEPSTWIAVVDGRSSILFATLAGVSIGLATGGGTPVRGERLRVARIRLGVRAAILWVLGVALILTGVPVYVILPAYALLFLLALPLLSLSARSLLMLAAVLALVMPFAQVALDELPLWRSPLGEALSLALGWHYPFTTWIAFLVAGLGVARAGVSRLPVQVGALAIGSALAAVAYGLDAASGLTAGDESSSYGGALWTARAHSSGLLEVIGSGGFALAVIGASLLACRTAVRWVVLPLRAVGAMPLTAYIGQLIVWAAVATAVLGAPGDLAGFRDLEPFWPLVGGTVVACTAWALLIGRGPFEWLVDRSSRLVADASADRLVR